MEFGIFSHGLGGRHDLAADSYDVDLSEIVAADELGFREAWIAEHVSRTTSGIDFQFDAAEGHDVLAAVNPFIGKAAALTKHIRLGPGVRPLAWYQPLQVALEANVCDHLTRGRYMLGIGTGGYSNNQMEQRGIGDEVGGLDPRQRTQGVETERHGRWHEAMDLIMKAWTAQEPFDYEGRFYRGKRAFVKPGPYQKPHPSVGVACSFSAPSVEFAGRKGFLPVFAQYTEAAKLRELGDVYVRAATAAQQPVGRKDIRATRYVYVADSDEQARRAFAPGVAREMENLNTRFVVQSRYLRQGDPPEAMNFDYLVDAGYVIPGDPDTVFERLKQDYEASGGYGVLLLVMGHDVATLEQRTRSMSLFMHEVAPRLNELDRKAAGAMTESVRG